MANFNKGKQTNTTTDKLDNRPSEWNRKKEIPEARLKFGSTKGLIAQRLDARTIVMMRPGSDPEKVKKLYEEHMNTFHWLDTSGNTNRK